MSNPNIPEKFTCDDCGRRIQVGDWVNQVWYCVWCVKSHKKPAPYSPPPPYIPPTYPRPEEKGRRHMHAKARMETKIEEIPCDNQL